MAHQPAVAIIGQHDLALGQMPMAHHPAVAIIGQLIGMTAEEARNLGLHGMH
jgi:hypothetical protein